MESQPTNATDSGARGLRLRLFFTLAADGALRGFAVAACGTGAVLLVARFFVPRLPSAALVVLAAALAFVTAAAALWNCRRTPSAGRCRAALDDAARAGGLIMIHGLPGAEQWRPPRAEPPRVVWHGLRPCAAALAAALFCVAALAAPAAWFAALAPVRRLDVRPLAQPVLEQAAALADADILPAPKAEALTNDLARLAENGDATDPARALEALDHLADEVDRATADGIESATDALESLQAAKTLADAMAAAAAAGTLPSAGDAAAQTRAALADLLAALPVDEATKADLLAAAAAPGGLTADQLKALSKKLGKAGAARADTLAKLTAARRRTTGGTPKPGGRCGRRGTAGSCGGGEAGEDALERMLAEGGEAGEAAATCAAACGTPGTGAPTRGRGDAPLTWNDPLPLTDAKFREHELAPGTVNDDRSQLVGLSLGAPETAGAAAAVTPGQAAPGGRATGATATAPVLPRHRRAVENYFGTKKE